MIYVTYNMWSGYSTCCPGQVSTNQGPLGINNCPTAFHAILGINKCPIALHAKQPNVQRFPLAFGYMQELRGYQSIIHIPATHLKVVQLLEVPVAYIALHLTLRHGSTSSSTSSCMGAVPTFHLLVVLDQHVLLQAEQSTWVGFRWLASFHQEMIPDTLSKET